MAASRVFVSHSHQNTAFCRDYVEGLRGRGFDVWYDEHNLGWGALRATIEREMPLCQHFVAILSPAAVGSEWVNAEIDAALELLRESTLKTITFVVAEPCTVPLLLRRWKRIEGPSGAPVSVAEAVAKTAAIIAPPSTTPAAAQAQTDQQAPTIAPVTLPPAQFPARLASLGFTAQQRGDVAYLLPPLCPIPAGPFLMGSDKRLDNQAEDRELPQHSVTVPAFQIARFPVTVAEYACAVRAKAMREPPKSGEVDWQKQLTQLDHPVVCVSWHDAVAYAAWLAQVTGQPWWLPAEAEWEKAARWDAQQQVSRIYPWGDTFDATCANTYESGKDATTPVGSYPTGASLYGVQDMAGNVWEWTSSLYKSYHHTQTDGREDINSTGTRALRGGSWADGARYARAACRIRGGPGDVYNFRGFRLVLAPAVGS